MFAPCYDIVLNGQVLPPPSLAGSPETLHAERAAWELSVTETEAARSSCILRVRYAFSGRLGNWILQYVAARVRALALDVAFESPKGFLLPPFEGLPNAVGRWEGLCEATSALPRHHVLLRPRGSNPSSAPLNSAVRLSDADLVSAYWRRGDGATGGTALTPAPSPALLSALRRLHEAVSESFVTVAGPAMLAAPTVEYVSNTSLFVGLESEVRGWVSPCLALEPGGSPGHAPGSARDSVATGSWGPNDVAIHVRLGDILHAHHAAYRPLPLSFYR
jgi:hypothetical protein